MPPCDPRYSSANRSKTFVYCLDWSRHKLLKFSSVSGEKLALNEPALAGDIKTRRSALTNVLERLGVLLA